jgi:hypothetical protein
MPEFNFMDELALRRCRVVMEYPKRQGTTGLRWSSETPLVVDESYQGRILPISKLWTTVAYFPFPEAKEQDINIPQTPVISEEQNCSLEFTEDGIPLLHLTMWQRDTDNPTVFTNRAFNLCLGITKNHQSQLGEADMWETCKQLAVETPSTFSAPGHHPLHKSARYHFFDGEFSHQPSNLPVLVVQSKDRSTVLKSPEELVVLIITNALAGRMPLVTPNLCKEVQTCIQLFPKDGWNNNLTEVLADLLWSGLHTQLLDQLITEFKLWCAGNEGIYPAWALDSEFIKTLPKTAFYAGVLSSVAVFQHGYGAPHLSPAPFVEEVRQLRCIPDTKEFVWESGHTKSSILTSSWVKNQLQIRNQTMEVKTFSYSGERLKLSI